MSSSSYEDLKLMGSVQLDEQSFRDLKAVVRDEVIEEYDKKGVLLCDVKKFMKNTDPVTLYHVLCDSIDDVLSEGRTTQLRTSCDSKKIEKLELIRGILDI